MNEKDLPTSWYYNIVNFQIISKKKKRIDDSENYRINYFSRSKKTLISWEIFSKTHNDRASSTMNLFKLNLEKFHEQTYFSSRAGIQSAETDRRRELN